MWLVIGVVGLTLVSAAVRLVRRTPPAARASPGELTAADLGLIDLEPGTFRMGDPDAAPSDDYDEHAHTVTLTRPFRLAARPTTVEQFARFVDRTGHQTDAERAGRGQGRSAHGFGWYRGLTWRTASAGRPGDTPVTVVSWNDAVAYCRWASAAAGFAVRLPTEAEWEYACRAGTTGPYHADAAATDLGWFADNSGDGPLDAYRLFQRDPTAAVAALAAAGCRPRPVGRKRPNAWGLYDMHGNVWQWCADAFGPYPDRPVTDPTGPRLARPTFRSARCAGWCDWPGLGTSYNRGRWTPDVGYNHIGFRVAADGP